MYAGAGKRAFDFALATLIALPALVLCLVCIVAIRSESNGAAVFRQVRVGRHRTPFVLYKLRTMSKDTGDHASHEVSHGQVTRVGRFLRRTKIDELPQLINVLRGDMSFVGPRPCLPSQQILIEQRDKLGAYSVRPGITGPAQIAGVDMSMPFKLAAMDAQYAENISLAGDLRYLAMTALGRGSGDAVKRS